MRPGSSTSSASSVGELEAATYTAESLADIRDWVLVTVAADVARAYLDMRAFQRQLAVLRKNVDVAKSSFDFQKSRFATRDLQRTRPCVGRALFGDFAVKHCATRSPNRRKPARHCGSPRPVSRRSCQRTRKARQTAGAPGAISRQGCQSICYAGGRTFTQQNANLLRLQRASA